MGAPSTYWFRVSHLNVPTVQLAAVVAANPLQLPAQGAAGGRRPTFMCRKRPNVVLDVSPANVNVSELLATAGCPVSSVPGNSRIQGNNGRKGSAMHLLQEGGRPPGDSQVVPH